MWVLPTEKLGIIVAGAGRILFALVAITVSNRRNRENCVL